jgi:hypothetical protein
MTPRSHGMWGSLINASSSALVKIALARHSDFASLILDALQAQIEVGDRLFHLRRWQGCIPPLCSILRAQPRFEFLHLERHEAREYGWFPQ